MICISLPCVKRPEAFFERGNGLDREGGGKELVLSKQDATIRRRPRFDPSVQAARL